MTSINFHLQPGGSLKGRCRVPGDKSISHRAIMLGSIAEGLTRIRGLLEGDDNIATLNAFRSMGVEISGPRGGELRINGRGFHGLKGPEGSMDLGNSGTSMRLLCGLLAGQKFDSCLVGDASLSKRPMGRVTEPLALMRGDIETTPRGTAPLVIHGNPYLEGVRHELRIASAQVKSCLLLAGLYAAGTTSVVEPGITRDHTERMLQGFSYPVERKGNRVAVKGGGSLLGTNINIPADISSAAFFMVGASIAENSDITLEHVGVNPTRAGVIDILNLMGARIETKNLRQAGGEPVADIRVRSTFLKGIRIPEQYVPVAIDEFPAIFIAAACAKGETVLTGAKELRVKESDRIQVMLEGLIELGVDAVATDDGLVIQGGSLGGGIIDSKGDHRVAMAFSMAALRARGEIIVTDCKNVDTSFPGFQAMAQFLGLQITTEVDGQ
ncbi:MAG: 3-phosphoshikimate 1-carboxyvinyltransferase [Methylococcales bacterium]|nr:3-phosphoshikimate 1-carboxyvinyltransferase [Methylococcales bacterium]